jgi:hypothetical protein
VYSHPDLFAGRTTPYEPTDGSQKVSVEAGSVYCLPEDFRFSVGEASRNQKSHVDQVQDRHSGHFHLMEELAA